MNVGCLVKGGPIYILSVPLKRFNQHLVGCWLQKLSGKYKLHKMKGESFCCSKWKIFLNDLHMCIPKLARNFLIMENTVILPYAETLPSKTVQQVAEFLSQWRRMSDSWGLQLSVRCNQMQDFRHVVQSGKETSWITNRNKKTGFQLFSEFYMHEIWLVVKPQRDRFHLQFCGPRRLHMVYVVTEKLIFLCSHVLPRQPIRILDLLAKTLPDASCG